MTNEEAEDLTRHVWNGRRSHMIKWLITRGFTPKAAARAAESYVETMAFVAKETGEPYFGKRKSD